MFSTLTKLGVIHMCGDSYHITQKTPQGKEMGKMTKLEDG